jgi:pyrroloquinoline quinone biosynthesis protein B
MKIRVLGSAAGGGFPQWNCNCPMCDGQRKGTIRAQARTQSSIAVSQDGVRWVLLNASPDILTQIKHFPALQPGRAIRDTGISSVVLMDAQIDHTTGLLMLREGKILELYCTEPVHDDLSVTNPILKLLTHYCEPRWHRIGFTPEDVFSPIGAEDLEFSPIPVSGKAPPYSSHREDPHEGDNLGLSIRDKRTGKTVFYAPGLVQIDDKVEAAWQAADCLLVDGTCWTDDEMARRGIAHKLARQMGHLPQSGPGGMIEQLSRFPDKRRVLIHINNTNPILDEDSPERAELTAAGIEVSYDGMEIEL